MNPTVVPKNNTVVEFAKINIQIARIIKFIVFSGVEIRFRMQDIWTHGK